MPKICQWNTTLPPIEWFNGENGTQISHMKSNILNSGLCNLSQGFTLQSIIWGPHVIKKTTLLSLLLKWHIELEKQSLISLKFSRIWCHVAITNCRKSSDNTYRVWIAGVKVTLMLHVNTLSRKLSCIQCPVPLHVWQVYKSKHDKAKIFWTYLSYHRVS